MQCVINSQIGVYDAFHVQTHSRSVKTHNRCVVMYVRHIKQYGIALHPLKTNSQRVCYQFHFQSVNLMAIWGFIIINKSPNCMDLANI